MTVDTALGYKDAVKGPPVCKDPKKQGWLGANEGIKDYCQDSCEEYIRSLN